MQIVTDGGMDLPQDQIEALNIHIIPHGITINGKTYRSNVDIQSKELYRLLEETKAMPKTSVPPTGDFVETYRRLAKTDPDILSIHMSSGLSAPINVAAAAKEMVPEANITIVDSKTLSAALGWMVSAAARAAQAGWPVERIVAMIHKIEEASESIYTLDDLTYLIHGGRISHMKGLIASALNIRPIIGVEKAHGTYHQIGMARTFKGALKALVKQVSKRHPHGTALQIQVGHADNPQAVEVLRGMLAPLYEITWMPTLSMTAVLGAHTGPTMVGMAFAATADLPEIP